MKKENSAPTLTEPERNESEETDAKTQSLCGSHTKIELSGLYLEIDQADLSLTAAGRIQ